LHRAASSPPSTRYVKEKILPNHEYRVVTVDADLENRLNALASEGFEVSQMTDQRVILLRTTTTTESERTRRAQTVTNPASESTP